MWQAVIRRPISKVLQIRVFRRDKWLCRWCGAPVIFPPAMRLLDEAVRRSRGDAAIAYFHPNWTRRDAPLLDYLGAVIDHVEAFGTGGVDGESNLATACNKCNARKNMSPVAAFTLRSPRRAIHVVTASLTAGMAKSFYCSRGYSHRTSPFPRGLGTIR